MLRTSIFFLLLLLTASCNLFTADLSLMFTDQKGRPIEGVVVEKTGVTDLPKNTFAIIDQIDKQYIPVVSVLTKGTSVTFPNKDNIRHHVYSFSKPKVFELPLYEGVAADKVTFNQAGIVVLGCNIHDWMSGYIYVAASSVFSVSDDKGLLLLEDLPEGVQSFRVWHPRIRKNSIALEFDFTPGAESEQVSLKIKPERKVRRSPGGGSRAY